MPDIASPRRLIEMRDIVAVLLWIFATCRAERRVAHMRRIQDIVHKGLSAIE